MCYSTTHIHLGLSCSCSDCCLGGLLPPRKIHGTQLRLLSLTYSGDAFTTCISFSLRLYCKYRHCHICLNSWVAASVWNPGILSGILISSLKNRGSYYFDIAISGRIGILKTHASTKYHSYRKMFFVTVTKTHSWNCLFQELNFFFWGMFHNNISSVCERTVPLLKLREK
jgi:hypothetical protein